MVYEYFRSRSHGHLYTRTCSRPSIEMVGFIIFTVRLLVVGPVLKWLALLFLLCRLLVVGPVLKWLALFMYYCADYSRTRLRRTRLGNNKKYVLTEVRLIRGTSYPST